MDWRTWIHQTLIGAVPVTTLVPAARIFGSGSVQGVPKDKPFIILTFGARVAPIPTAHRQTVTVWVHDEPGDYLRIDQILAEIRSVLEGQVSSAGAIGCRWSGDSTDLADDAYGTITRNSSYDLVGSD